MTNDGTSTPSLASLLSLREREMERLMGIVKIDVLFWNFDRQSLANLDW
jgi:hypothetical protein